MNIGNWLDKVGDSFTKAIVRYPVTFAILLALCFYLSSTVDNRIELKEAIFFGFVIAGLSSILLYNLAEVLGYGNVKKHIIASASIALGLLFYWLYESVFIDDTDWKGIVFGVVIFCIVLFYLLLPFIKKNNNPLLQRYFVQFFENYGESFALSLILYLVLISAIGAVDMLFNVGLNDLNLYSHFAIWIGGLFMPLNFLSKTPLLPVTEGGLPKYESRFFKILILYIGIPVALVYGAIIIAYAVKFVITGESKEWTLSMFVWFLALGLLVYLMNKIFIQDNKNEIATLFDKYFPYLGVVLSISSLLICYTSIQKIGLTTSYYFVAMFSLITLLIFSMLSFWRAMDYRIIYGLMAGASIFAIVSGPLDCYEAPIKSQGNRLISFLESNDRYDKNGYKASKSSVDQITLSNISNGVNSISIEAFDKIARQNDISKFIKDTIKISPFDLFQKLGVDYSLTAIDNNADKGIYRELPAIKFEQDDEYVPLLNPYVNIPNSFNGIKVSSEGNFGIYSNGRCIDSISLIPSQLMPIPIKTKSVVKSQNYEIYFQNINYKISGNQVLIKDFTGMIIKKAK
jgi:hypothetical protein